MGIEGIVMQLLARYGLQAALAAALLFGVLFVAYRYAMARIALMQQESQNRETERAAEVQSRERERQALIVELSSAREQNYKVLSNHLAHAEAESSNLRETMDRFSRAQQEQIVTLRTLTENLMAHRDSMARKFEQVSQKLETIHVEVARGER